MNWEVNGRFLVLFGWFVAGGMNLVVGGFFGCFVGGVYGQRWLWAGLV
jgi:hypothetical protein